MGYSGDQPTRSRILQAYMYVIHRGDRNQKEQASYQVLRDRQQCEQTHHATVSGHPEQIVGAILEAKLAHWAAQ